MADIENPYVDGGAATVAEAEPAECSRCTFMCVLGCLAVALFVVFQYSVEFRDSHRASRTELDVAAAVVGLVALFVGGWVLFISSVMVMEWCRGNPEEQRLVDSLIQSDRCFLLEAGHQLLRYVDPHVVHA
jgi:hypothetical protein